MNEPVCCSRWKKKRWGVERMYEQEHESGAGRTCKTALHEKIITNHTRVLRSKMSSKMWITLNIKSLTTGMFEVKWSTGNLENIFWQTHFIRKCEKAQSFFFYRNKLHRCPPPIPTCMSADRSTTKKKERKSFYSQHETSKTVFIISTVFFSSLSTVSDSRSHTKTRELVSPVSLLMRC